MYVGRIVVVLMSALDDGDEITHVKMVAILKIVTIIFTTLARLS
jgi:hypothetical protein